MKVKRSAGQFFTSGLSFETDCSAVTKSDSRIDCRLITRVVLDQLGITWPYFLHYALAQTFAHALPFLWLPAIKNANSSACFSFNLGSQKVS